MGWALAATEPGAAWRRCACAIPGGAERRARRRAGGNHRREGVCRGRCLMPGGQARHRRCSLLGPARRDLGGRSLGQARYLAQRPRAQAVSARSRLAAAAPGGRCPVRRPARCLPVFPQASLLIGRHPADLAAARTQARVRLERGIWRLGSGRRERNCDPRHRLGWRPRTFKPTDQAPRRKRSRSRGCRVYWSSRVLRVRAFRTAFASPSLLKYANTSLPAAFHSCIRSAHHVRSVSL